MRQKYSRFAKIPCQIDVWTIDEVKRQSTSALVYFPIAFGVKSHLQKTVLGIMSFGAPWTNEVTAPSRALTIVILGDGKGQSATAGD
jgi:hypothetical protein